MELFIIVLVVALVGCVMVTGKAKRNTKSTVSGGMGSVAVLIWIAVMGFYLYSIYEVTVLGRMHP